MINAVRQKWDTHWWGELSAREAGLYRAVFFTFLSLYYSFFSSPFMWHWSRLPDDLWLPVGVLSFFKTPPLSQETLYTIELFFPLVLLLCALGLFTKLSLICAFVAQYIMVSFSLSYGSISHTHFATTIFLFLFIFLDCSHSLSIDSLLFKKQSSKRVSFWPIQLQRWVFGGVFFAAAYSKLSTAGLGWVTSDTLRNYLSYSYYRYSLSPLGTELALGLWLTRFPFLCKALAFSTVSLELFSPILVFLNKKTRYLFLLPHFIMFLCFYFLATTGFVNMFSIYLCWLFNESWPVTGKAKDEVHI